jgi:hypothetical protein
LYHRVDGMRGIEAVTREILGILDAAKAAPAV